MKNIVLIGSISVAALVTVSINPADPLVIWNQTESVPRGLYIRDGKPVGQGSLVAFLPEKQPQLWLAERGYLPENVPMLKRVKAVEGDRICRSGKSISINELLVAIALEEDRTGRLLPQWGGCHTLAHGEIFLLNDHAQSLDGRYFGVSDVEGVIGRYRLIWKARS